MTKARAPLGPARILRHLVSLVRQHPRRGVEVVALVVLAGSLHLLAGWTAFGTGSIGEAHMVRILAAGTQVVWFLLLPLGLARWWHARAPVRSRTAAVAEGWPGDLDPESWTACGRRLLVALFTVTLAPSAAVTLMEAYAIQGGLPQTFSLVAMAAVVALVGESMVGDPSRRARAVRPPALQVRAVGAASVPPPDVAVDAVPSLVGEEAAGWRGAAAPGRFPSRGLPEGVVARAEFFSDLEFDLRRSQCTGRPFTLLVVGAEESAVDGAVRHILGEILARTFVGSGLVGYLGGNRWGIGLAGLATDAVSQGAEDMRMLLAEEAAKPGQATVSPCIGVAVSVGREPARELYAKALGSYQSAFERAAAEFRVG